MTSPPSKLHTQLAAALKQVAFDPQGLVYYQAVTPSGKPADPPGTFDSAVCHAVVRSRIWRMKFPDSQDTYSVVRSDGAALSPQQAEVLRQQLRIMLDKLSSRTR